MAGSTGLEPATSGLTVQCANQAAPRARVGTSRGYTTAAPHATVDCAQNCALTPLRRAFSREETRPQTIAIPASGQAVLHRTSSTSLGRRRWNSLHWTSWRFSPERRGTIAKPAWRYPRASPTPDPLLELKQPVQR